MRNDNDSSPTEQPNLKLFKEADKLLEEAGYDINGQPITNGDEDRDYYFQRRFEHRMTRCGFRGASRRNGA